MEKVFRNIGPMAIISIPKTLEDGAKGSPALQKPPTLHMPISLHRHTQGSRPARAAFASVLPRQSTGIVRGVLCTAPLSQGSSRLSPGLWDVPFDFRGFTGFNVFSRLSTAQRC